MFHRLALSTYPAETRRAGFETLSTSAKGTPPARTRHLWTVEAPLHNCHKPDAMTGRASGLTGTIEESGAPGIGLMREPWACL